MQRRNTNQKQIVLNSLEMLGHADTEKLIEYINSNYENISLATIYRNLTILQDEEKIKKIKVGSLDVYETIKEKHYHFRCDLCGEIIDIMPNELPSGMKELNKLGDYDIRSTDIVFYGICKQCKRNVQ